MSSENPKELACLWTCCLGNTAPVLQHPKMSWATQMQQPWLYRWETHLLREQRMPELSWIPKAVLMETKD